MDAGGTLALLAGDNLTEPQGAGIDAGVSIFLKSDYQGDLNGVPPATATPSTFVTVGTAILLVATGAAAASAEAGGWRAR